MKKLLLLLLLALLPVLTRADALDGAYFMFQGILVVSLVALALAGITGWLVIRA